MEVSGRAKWIIGLVAVLALALSTYVGVQLPQPVVVDPPVFEQTRGGAVQVNQLVVQDTLTVGGTASADLTGGLVINSDTYTATAPITITGVLSNVRLLYFQE